MKFDSLLEMSESLVLILKMIYIKTYIPEGAVPHLLVVTQEHYGTLCDLL